MKYKILVIVALFASCGTSQILKTNAPNWIENEARNKAYPSNFYLRGFSLSNKLEWEKMDDFIERISSIARKELLESIKVEVNSTSVLNNQEVVNNGITNLKSTYKILSQSNSKLEIANIVIDKHYDANSKTGYAFAYVKRADVIQFYANIIKQNLQTIESNLQEAAQFSINEKHQKAKQIYAKAISFFEAMYTARNILNALKVNDDDLLQDNRINKNMTIINQAVAKSIQVESIVLDTKKQLFDGVYNEALQENIVVDIKLNNKNKDVVSGIPIKFYQDSNVFCNNISDAKGSSTCYFNKIINKQKVQNIYAALNLETYLETSSAIAQLPIFNNLANILMFTIHLKKTKFYVQSNEYDGDGKKSMPFLEAKVKAILSDNEFVFVEKTQQPKYCINIEAKPTITKNGTDVVFAYMNVSLSILETNTQTEVYKNAFNNIKGAGMNTDRAIALANKKTIEVLEADLKNWLLTK